MRGRVKGTDIVNTASIASGQGFRLRALLREQRDGAVE